MTDQKEGDMIPVRDERGNFLTLGCEVVWTGSKNRSHLKGKVTGWKKGGISLIETGEKTPKETPAMVRITFDMLIAVLPGQNMLMEYFRIINPDQETLLNKLLDKETESIQ